MSVFADKSSDQKNKSSIHKESTQKANHIHSPTFSDNRPEAIAQRKLLDLVNNSPQMEAAAEHQARADQYVSNHLSKTQGNIVQRTKMGAKIAYTFNAPQATIRPVFSNGNNVYGAPKFEYDVDFDIDEQGTKGTDSYRIGEFRQYFKGGMKVFGQQYAKSWKNDWVEDTLHGGSPYGYRGANTHASKYVINEGDGDKLELWDKVETTPVDKPDEINYATSFKGEVVAVDKPGGEVKEILATKFWDVKGMGTRDENDNIYYDKSYGQVKDPKPKSQNLSKKNRKEAAGKYEAPDPD